MKSYIKLVTAFSICILALLSSCSSTDSSRYENEFMDDEKEGNPESEVAIQYDELQQFYLDIDKSLIYDSLIQKLENSHLFYRTAEFKGSNAIEVKIAMNEKVTPFLYAEAQEDHVLVSFNMKDLTFDSATYWNIDTFATLIHYEKGGYHEFRDQPEYAGYYIDQIDIDDKIPVKYPNGNTVEANYRKVQSKTEQFKYIYTIAN